MSTRVPSGRTTAPPAARTHARSSPRLLRALPPALCLRLALFCLLACSLLAAAFGPLAGAARAAGGREAAPRLLARSGSGTVAAWGDNSSGQTTVPAGLSHVVAVSAGDEHSLALKADGTVAAWGNDSSGQLNVPAGLNGVVALSAGSSHSLALKADGTVAAWGNDSSGQLNVPAGLSGVVALSAGGLHSLALKADVAVGTPLASPQTVAVGFYAPEAITLTGTDPDVPALPLTYAVATAPAHGTLSGTAPNLTYTPAAGYHGADSFTFQVSNGTNTSGAATVSIAVAQGVPTANPQSVSVAFNTATAITLTGTDPDVPALTLTYSVTSGPSHGTLTGTAPSLTYTPTAGYHGPDSFTFTVNNGTYTSGTATLTLNVAAGVPTANPQSVSVAFNTATAVTLTGTDPDVPALTLTYSVITSPIKGTLSGTAPNLTYTPNAGYHGPDAFSFQVSNGFKSSIAEVTLTVAAGVPTANPQSVSVAFNTATAITLTGSDPDVPALPLTYSVATGPAHGTLSGTAPNLTYTPAAGYFGADGFTFTVSNGVNISSAATVSITVTQVIPVVTDVTAQVTVTRGGFRFVRATRHYFQPVTLTNTGATLLDPVSLVLDNLAGATLVAASGTTSAAAPSGSPYVTLPTGGLAAGASVTVTLEFTAQPSGYSVRVLAGPGAR